MLSSGQDTSLSDHNLTAAGMPALSLPKATDSKAQMGKESRGPDHCYTLLPIDLRREGITAFICIPLGLSKY